MRYFNFDTTYMTLPEIFFDINDPATCANTDTLIFNDTLAKSLNIDTNLSAHPELLTGQTTYSQPFSAAYASHQFSNFTMLGDGRQHILGEHITKDNKRFDIQLKGSGRTRYSRSGDGRASLGPMLREYIISEAMHYLNIPTTRSLAVCTTGEPVMRETVLPGAILTRVAASNIRVGTFEYAIRNGTDNLKLLADYTIKRHYPYLSEEEDKYFKLLECVINRQAELIAKWQSVGFIHGVMNTDNMTLSGETIDYGPCAFMDYYHPYTVFSSIDVQGRYAYENQPAIGQWNLARFAETLLPLIHSDQSEAIRRATLLLDQYKALYHDHYLRIMCHKIGIEKYCDEDFHLIETLLECMEQHEMDYTNTFIHLQNINQYIEALKPLSAWIKRWEKRLQAEHAPQQLMRSTNPVVIPRNHLVEAALDDAVNADMTTFNTLLDVLKRPFDTSHPHLFKQPGRKDRPYITYCGT